MGGDCTRAADRAQHDFGEGFNTDGQQLNDDEDEALQQKSESAPHTSASRRPAAPVLRVMVNQEWVPLQVMLALRASGRFPRVRLARYFFFDPKEKFLRQLIVCAQLKGGVGGNEKKS